MLSQIKLNPTNGDCWNTLAHVLFKKGDIESSQQAVTMALEHVWVMKVRKAKIKSVFDTNRSYSGRRAVLSPICRKLRRKEEKY